MHHKGINSSISLILNLSFHRFVRSVFKKCKIWLRRRAIITSPPKSAVCSKLSPITLARPNLLLSCGTSHKVSSQSGSSYFTDSSTQKYSRNQKLCICEMWMAWDLRPQFASVWPWPKPISPIIRTVHHDPARRRNPYGILPLWCNPPKIKEPPIMTQTHPHHFEIPQKKILMSYFIDWLLFNSRPNFCWPPQIPIGKMQNASHDEPDCGLHVQCYYTRIEDVSVVHIKTGVHYPQLPTTLDPPLLTMSMSVFLE